MGVEAAVVAGDDGDVALFQERGGEGDGVGDGLPPMDLPK